MPSAPPLHWPQDTGQRPAASEDTGRATLQSRPAKGEAAGRRPWGAGGPGNLRAAPWAHVCARARSLAS